MPKQCVSSSAIRDPFKVNRQPEAPADLMAEYNRRQAEVLAKFGIKAA